MPTFGSLAFSWDRQRCPGDRGPPPFGGIAPIRAGLATLFHLVFQDRRARQNARLLFPCLGGLKVGWHPLLGRPHKGPACGSAAEPLGSRRLAPALGRGPGQDSPARRGAERRGEAPMQQRLVQGSGPACPCSARGSCCFLQQPLLQEETLRFQAREGREGRDGEGRHGMTGSNPAALLSTRCPPARPQRSAAHPPPPPAYLRRAGGGSSDVPCRAGPCRAGPGRRVAVRGRRRSC